MALGSPASGPYSASLEHPCPEKTRSDLEYSRLLDALADRAKGAMGRAFARTLPFASTVEESRLLLAESEEATRLRRDGAPLPFHDEIPDVREPLDRLRVNAVLGPGELRAVAGVLGRARSLRRFLQAHKAACPRLFDA